MSGCPLENPCGFYVVYLRGNDMDFMGRFCRDSTSFEYSISIFKIQLTMHVMR